MARSQRHSAAAKKAWETIRARRASSGRPFKPKRPKGKCYHVFDYVERKGWRPGSGEERYEKDPVTGFYKLLPCRKCGKTWAQVLKEEYGDA